MPLQGAGFRKAGDELFDRATKEWRSLLPRDQFGQPLGHRGGMESVAEFATTGQLTAGDETGQVRLGPSGFTVERSSADGSPGWKAVMGGDAASLQVGDVAVGGSWGQGAPSGFIGVGPVQLDGGYGHSPNPLAGPPAPGSKPGAWGELSVRLGRRSGPFSAERSARQAGRELDTAVSPFAQPEQLPPAVSAREEMERQLAEYRARNPRYYQP
jgi:hypothetical protein